MNTQELYNKILALEQEVRELKQSMGTQQIKYPLDGVSKQIVQENLPVFISFTAGSPTTNGSVLVQIDGQNYKLMTTA